MLATSFEAACVTGGNRPQPFALVLVAEHLRGSVGKGPGRNRLADRPVNAALDPHERLDKLVVIGEPWTIENGMLTPSLKIKIKRAVVETRCAAYVDAWHATSDRVVWFDG